MLKGLKCCQGGRTPFDQCLECSRRGECEYPLHLLHYMERGALERAELGYSVTSILGCARRHVIQQRFDYYESPGDVIARFVGDAVHVYANILNANEPGYVGEERVYANINLKTPTTTHSIKLSGKADQRWRKTRIVDLKTTNRIPETVLPDHVAQVNLYAWMMANGVDETGKRLGLAITSGAVTYISANEKRQQTFAVPIWPQAQTEDYLSLHLEKFLPWIEDGVYPEVLPPGITPHADGSATIKRHWHCDFCPVRTECDQLGAEERGVSPNEAAYWRDGYTTAVGEATFVDEFAGRGYG